MKTKFLILFSSIVMLFFAFSSFKTANNLNDSVIKLMNQNGLIVYAAYDGHEDYGYNFIVTDKDGEEQTLTFQKVEEEVLKVFDLNSETLLKTKFKITFNREIKVTKDSDGYDDENEVNTITSLEKL